MSAHHPHRGPHPRTAARQAAARLRRLAATLAASASIPIPPGGPGVPSPPVLVVSGGMAGWLITLIAVGAALVAATVAVLLDRARDARRAAPATTT